MARVRWTRPGLLVTYMTLQQQQVQGEKDTDGAAHDSLLHVSGDENKLKCLFEFVRVSLFRFVI